MNQCGVQRQSAFSFCDEIWSSSSMERRETVVCPKPRRLGRVNGVIHDPPPVRSLRWHVMHQAEPCDSRSEREVLDAFLTKGSLGNEPPFFSGSPPSRVTNPLIHDARFGNENFPILPLSSTPPSARSGGCVRGSFGNVPIVRVEGFDCLDRDGRNCRITALA